MLKQLNERCWLILAKLDNKYTTNEIFEELWKLHPEKVGNVLIYGKYINTPRYHASYGKSYGFSGQTLEKQDNTPEILNKIKNIIEQWRNHKYDQILINWYRNGHHYIGKHSDDERQLEPNSEIVSVSLGVTRKFRIRNKRTNDIIYDINLENGYVVIMGGSMQKEFTHEIVKVCGKKGESIGKRINITFRVWKK